jgi:hypothetical protein
MMFDMGDVIILKESAAATCVLRSGSSHVLRERALTQQNKMPFGDFEVESERLPASPYKGFCPQVSS